MDDTMNKRPSLQFYPADWRKDPQLQMCDMATQGIWINLLCCMWESNEEGKLEGSWEDFARLLGISVPDFKKFYIHANRHKFADVTECSGIVTIINRRMYGVFLERERAKKGMREHRAKKGYENVTPHSSTSSSTSSSKQKNKGRFAPPTLSEVQSYITEKKYSVSAVGFWNFYESKGWFVGKNKMKDWRRAVAGWAARDEQEKPDKPPTTARLEQAVCIVDHKPATEYSLDQLGKPTYLCSDCIKAIGHRNWGIMPKSEIEKAVEEGKRRPSTAKDPELVVSDKRQEAVMKLTENLADNMKG